MFLVRCARLRPVFLTLLFSITGSSLLRAQSGPDNDPAAAQGYVDNSFHESSIDSINEFNGQLTVPIAVGPEYPVGPSLKLQLTFVYNSKVWDYGAPVPEDALGEWRPIAGDLPSGSDGTSRRGRSSPAEPTFRESASFDPMGPRSFSSQRRRSAEFRTGKRRTAISTACPAWAVPGPTRCETETGSPTRSATR